MQTPPDTAEILDLSLIEQLRDLGRRRDKDILGKAIRIFFEGTPPHLEGIRRATAAGAVGELRDRAHSLKGNSGMVGAVRLQRLCGELEEIARAGGESSAAVAAVEEEYRRVVAELTRQKEIA